jgi:PAS domain S-box-containing protein
MPSSLSPSSDKLLSVVFDGPVGLAVVTADGPLHGRLLSANPAFGELLGYSEEELVELTFQAISHPDDTGAESEVFERLMSGDVDSLDVERRLLTSSGDVVWARLYVSRLDTGRDGESQAVVQVSDISEQKRLVAGQAAMIDAAIDAIVAVDSTGVITGFNPAAERVFGYSKQVVVGRPALELLVPPRLRESHVNALAPLAEGGIARLLGRRVELTGMRSDGSEFSLELTIARTQDSPAEYTGFVRDLTERRVAEQALEESERRYRRIVETSSEGLWMLDADHRTSFVNPRMAEILGVRPQDMIDKHPFEFMDEEGRDVARQALDRRREGVNESWQCKFIRRDGSEIWAWLSSSPLTEDDGSYGGSLAMVTDITEWIRAEHEREDLQGQLHQSQRLETVGKLAGGVAHDFNNLLSVILNYAAFLKEELDTSPEGAEGLGEIKRAAERGAALTRRLLAFSRRDTGRPRTLDLPKVVSDVRRLIERSIGAAVELEIETIGQVPPVVADVHQLEQMLLNLAINARDAMPDGGRLRVTLREVTLDEHDARLRADAEPGRFACIEVIDSGEGMSAEVAAQAFDPFFTTKPVGEGTGLGLAMVYGIATSAGGHVTLDSTPGEGTRIAVHLPAAARHADGPESPGTPTPRPAEGQTILLVDDESSVRTIAARILTKHGYEVVEAAGGDEALAIYRTLEKHPDLLLTDVAMPKMSGLELARRLPEERPPAPPVVFMSGYSGASVSTPEALERAAGFLQKPFNAEELLHCAGEALATGVRPPV